MNILINFATLKAGGGQNVGLNFLQFVLKNNFKNYNFHFVVAKDSALEQYLLLNQVKNFTSVPQNPLKRIIFEIFKGEKIIKKHRIDIIYTYFGLGIYPREIPQIIGSADSNLYFPELDFWQEYKGIKKLKRVIVDKYRIWGLKRATGIVFENEAMEKRCHQIYNIKDTIYIKPSINFNFPYKNYQLPHNVNTSVPKGLFLCGWQRNKNIFAIPEIAAKLKEFKQPFHFILTAPNDNSTDQRIFEDLCREHNVIEMISVIGGINKEELASIYEQIDYVFLLSKLESFSNNIIEAWYFKKPLIISKEEWSKSICENAAYYVDRNSPYDIACAIVQLESNDKLKSELIGNGQSTLRKYPTIEERTLQEIDFIQKIYEKN